MSYHIICLEPLQEAEEGGLARPRAARDAAEFLVSVIAIIIAISINNSFNNIY